MAIRSQVLPQPPSALADGPNNTFATMGRDVAMGQLYLLANGNRSFMGGMQSKDFEEDNGGEFMAMQGNDFLEPRFRLRQWRGTCNRWVVRGDDMQQKVRSLYNPTNPFDVDWRFLPMEWHYYLNMQNVTGNNVIEQISWNYMTIFIVRYRLSDPEPTGKQMEDFSWIGKGYTRATGDNAGGSGTVMQNFGSLWFSTAAAPASGGAAAPLPAAAAPGLPFSGGSHF